MNDDDEKFHDKKLEIRSSEWALMSLIGWHTNPPQGQNPAALMNLSLVLLSLFPFGLGLSMTWTGLSMTRTSGLALSIFSFLPLTHLV